MSALDSAKKKVWAKCLFVDPVADIAVLGCPDGQEFSDEAGAYSALVEDLPFLQISNAKSGPGWMLTLDNRWARIRLDVHTGICGGAMLEIDPTEAGQSGSPILNHAGRAVGVVVIGSRTLSINGKHKSNNRCGPQPILTRNLPGWLLEERPT